MNGGRGGGCGGWRGAAACIVAALVAASAARAALHGVREGGVVCIRIPDGDAGGTRLTVAYAPVRGWESCGDGVTIQTPDGAVLTRLEIPAGDGTGERTVALDRGAGDYRVAFAGRTFRAFTVSTAPARPIAIETAPVYPAFSTDLTGQYRFRVPPGAARFTFCVKNHTPEPLRFRLTPPTEGAAAIEGDVTPMPRDILSREARRPSWKGIRFWEHDRRVIEAPPSGIWTVSLVPPVKVGLWLEGIPSVFAETSDDLFEPRLAEGRAVVEADAGRVTGPVGRLGASFPGPDLTPLALERIRAMGLRSLCRYVHQDAREPRNDNADPHRANSDGFDWRADDARSDALVRAGLESLVIVEPAAWLGGRQLPERGAEAFAEYAEFVLALLERCNVARATPIAALSLLDEPNHRYSADALLPLLRTVAARLREHPDARVRATRLVAPQSSGFLEHPAGRDRAGVALAARLREAMGAELGGLAWNQWDYQSLLDTWRYGDAIRHAVALGTVDGPDGDRAGGVFIFQTNVHGGGAVSLHDTDTFRGALWWTAVVAQAMKTGRIAYLNWFPTFDDPHHRKGLCQALERGGALKPAAHAMRLLTSTLLTSAVASSGSHPEVDELVTVAADGRHINLLTVNKCRRRTTLHATIALPPSAGAACANIRFAVMRDGDTAPQPVAAWRTNVAGRLSLDRVLDGESIGVFDIRLEKDAS